MCINDVCEEVNSQMGRPDDQPFTRFIDEFQADDQPDILRLPRPTPPTPFLVPLDSV